MLLDLDFLQFSLREDVLVAMSFDGVTEAHDAHRLLPGGEPTHHLLEHRLRLLLETRPHASVLMVVNPDTAPRMCDSVSYLLDLGCRYLIISLNYATRWSRADLRTLERQYRRLGKLYLRWTRQRRKFYLSPLEVKISSHINRHRHREERCELARRQISVDPGGHLFPCVQFVRAGPQSEWCIGDLDRGIDETARTRLYQQSMTQKPACEGCVVHRRCNHTCGCLNWQVTGNLNGVSPVLCAHERMLMPIADHIGRVLYQRRDPTFISKHYNEAYPVLSLLEEMLEE